MVNMELNKATGVFKAWVNGGTPFTINEISPNSKVRGEGWGVGGGGCMLLTVFVYPFEC